jgi:hypothetical protein
MDPTNKTKKPNDLESTTRRTRASASVSVTPTSTSSVGNPSFKHRFSTPVSPRLKQIASFTFCGVITARTQDAAKEMRTHLEHLCETVIDTYRYCMDYRNSNEEKHAKLAEIKKVQADVEYFVKFCEAEIKACTVKQFKPKLEELGNQVKNAADKMKPDFSEIDVNPAAYDRLFDQLLRLLEITTQFLRENHKQETARVLEIAYECVLEVKKLRDLNQPEGIVLQTQLMSRKCLELVRAARKLVDTQNTDPHLPDRLTAAQTVLQSELPKFIKSVEAYFEDPADPSRAEKKTESAQQMNFVLEEFANIIRTVEATYTSEFRTNRVPVVNQAALNRLSNAVNNVNNMLLKLHTATSEAELAEAKQGLLSSTRGLVDRLGETPSDPNVKAQFAQAIKEGMQPEHSKLFASQKRLNDLLDNIQNRMAQLRSPSASEDVASRVAREDLLEAAKGMLASLKGMEYTLKNVVDVNK